jgi:hypothetical protein
MSPLRILLIAVLLAIALPAQAQQTLTYGEAVTGEITDEVPEQVYTFFGKTDEVIFIGMDAVDVLADLDRMMLILRDPEGQTIAERDSFSGPVVFAELPFDGTYTVIATRPEEDDSVGEYTLVAGLVPEISLGSSVTDTVTTEAGDHYYVYRGENDFFLNYTKEAGDFAPEVSVNIINEERGEGQLEVVGVVGGKFVRRGSMGAFPGNDLYIIRLGEASFSFSFGELTATYIIELLDAAKLE